MSIFTGLTFVTGFYFFMKENVLMSMISFIIIIYFCLITGPVISPKYCLPFIPIIIYFQSITLQKLLHLINNRYKGKND